MLTATGSLRSQKGFDPPGQRIAVDYTFHLVDAGVQGLVHSMQEVCMTMDSVRYFSYSSNHQVM